MDTPTLYKKGKKMSSIVKRKIKNQVYLYESESYRNEEGKPRNKRTLIGKIDPQTGDTIYKQEYINRMSGMNVQIGASVVEKRFSVSDIRNSTLKEYGAFYLYECIAKETGLYSILTETFPNHWKEIFNLACYLVSSGEPVMYCEDWISKTEAFPCKAMSSPRISELLKSISIEERMEFFERWNKHRSEQEYLALDITSISSYSELIGDVEWGYNRDKEKLPQINLCMLLGEKSGLPVFQSVYSGSLKDVSTLKTTLQLASSIPFNKVTIIMDKGFCSVKNINAMLEDTQGIRFLIAMSFTLKFTQTQVESEKKDIDCLENTIVLGDDILRCVTKERSWNSKSKVFTHIYYNHSYAVSVREKLYGRIAILIERAQINPNDEDYAVDFKKYLIIRKSDKTDSGYTINVRNDVVEKELANSGWLILVSNHISDAKGALSIYRAKDVVEKGFLHIKNSLDLGRLRVHSDTCMQNKVFIGFIALILMSRIHKVMLNKGLYRAMTMKKLLLTLEKLRVQYLAGTRILFPLTKEQKNIFEAFGFSEPV